jgi:hypothetical protein
MANLENRTDAAPPTQGEEQLAAAEDTRKPYEPPRLLKKRSVARATLFTVMGPAMTGITFMG